MGDQHLRDVVLDQSREHLRVKRAEGLKPSPPIPNVIAEQRVRVGVEIELLPVRLDREDRSRSNCRVGETNLSIVLGLLDDRSKGPVILVVQGGVGLPKLFPVIFQAPVERTFPRPSGPVDRRSRHHLNRTSEVANLRKGEGLIGVRIHRPRQRGRPIEEETAHAVADPDFTPPDFEHVMRVLRRE